MTPCFRNTVDQKASDLVAQRLILFRPKRKELLPIVCSFQKIQTYTTCLYPASRIKPGMPMVLYNKTFIGSPACRPFSHTIDESKEIGVTVAQDIIP